MSAVVKTEFDVSAEGISVELDSEPVDEQFKHVVKSGSIVFSEAVSVKSGNMPLVEQLEHIVKSEGDLNEIASSLVMETEDCSVSERVQLQNLPPFYSYKQIKSLLAKKVDGANARKVKCVGGKAFFSMSNVDEATRAVAALDGLEIKGKKLIAKFAKPEPLKGRHVPNDDGKPAFTKTARESVTPLSDLPYSDQLDRKVADTTRLLCSLIKLMVNANVSASRQLSVERILHPIRASPRVTGYRNKCEFTVGRSVDGKVSVGFVCGRFSQNQHVILPVDTCDHISGQMKRVVKFFEQFIIDSGFPPFDEFERKGVWKMLTLREFGCDLMVIVTVFPMENHTEEEELKKCLSKKFFQLSNFVQERFRVSSLYWQKLANASDDAVYEHLAGVPFIYGTILEARFRISPGAFFQTNIFAAEILYSEIAEKCGLITKEEKVFTASDSVTVEKSDQLFEDEHNLHDMEPVSKKTKADDSEEKSTTVLLDICCGTGTIGICIMNAIKRVKLTNEVFLVGVELVESAVKDARCNAEENLLLEHQFHFVAGKAEEVFRNLRSHLPNGVNLETAKVVGVLDPPRAGVHDRVILGCRMLSNMRRLVYVSCNPSMALKNLVDLCRPSSKKYSGEPFQITSITPVDMFPQTLHCEWIVQLDR